MNLTIATVLKTGGEYVEQHVHALRDQCAKHIPWADFVCLSDGNPDCETVPLQNDYPGWWAKMELFQLHGPILYMDLDTIVRASCDHWLSKIQDKRFVILRDVWRCNKETKAFGSGIMYWAGDMSWMYDKYVQAGCPEKFKSGDQGFIDQHFEGEYHYLQDFTNDVVSYKAKIRDANFPVEEASIVYFHGRPRPWEQQTVKWP